jgi:hypothetical protein
MREMSNLMLRIFIIMALDCPNQAMRGMGRLLRRHSGFEKIRSGTIPLTKVKSPQLLLRAFEYIFFTQL